jgi:ketosteroid isomerase-like protein
VSQENVELTLLALDAWNRRDLEAVIALIDAEGVGHPAFEGITEGRTWRGHAGMRQYFEDLAEFSTESHAEYPEIHDLGDRVLGLGRVWFGFAGGVDLDREAGSLFRWRNGKVGRMPGLGGWTPLTPTPSKPPVCGSRHTAALDEKRRFLIRLRLRRLSRPLEGLRLLAKPLPEACRAGRRATPSSRALRMARPSSQSPGSPARLAGPRR